MKQNERLDLFAERFTRVVESAIIAAVGIFFIAASVSASWWLLAWAFQ